MDSVFLLLKYQYRNIARHIFLNILILVSILVVLLLSSHSNFLLSILSLSGGVEMNPGYKIISNENFLICRWNLYSIIAHNYTKILLLKAYIAVYKIDITCLLETYFDTKTLTDDDKLDISGYILVHSDHLSNRKRD